jgi:hypothetical protein
VSITKESELVFEREFPTAHGKNDYMSLEFTVQGIEVDEDILTWADIKKAYKKLFNTEISQ